MPSLYRQLRRLQLQQASRRDQAAICRRYLEIRTSQKTPLPEKQLSLSQMIEALLDHDEAIHSTALIMRAIAA
jgi:hypothetical protein